MVLTDAQFQSTKPELRFCAGSNPARRVSDIRDGEDLRQWSRLKIRLNAFRRSTIPQKQFIIKGSCLDVTMGSFDRTEICELVGLYIQSKLEMICQKSIFLLYREDGLALLRNLNEQEADKVRKNMVLAFGLKLISKK